VSLAVTGAALDGETVNVRCAGGVIEALGPDVGPAPGDSVIDAEGAILCPPLLNGHTHAAMTLFRASGGDLPLMRWLEERIWPAEERLEPEDVYWGTRLACVEMIRSGTTRFWDMYWEPETVARAVADSGLRATVGQPLIEAGAPPGRLRAEAERVPELAAHGERVRPSLAPHSIYTVSEDSLRFVAALSAERDLPVQIHLAETAGEVEACLRDHGLRPAAYLDRVGLLSPRTALAHGVWLDRDELDLVGERGCTIVSNPVANQKLAVGGVFPYPAARAAGIAVGLGTDGPASNDSLDLLAELKAFALVQKHAAGDPAVVSAEECWEIATGERAPLLGATPLRPGEPADFILLRPDAPELAFGELPEALVFAAAGSVVDTTVVAGRSLMTAGEVPGADEVLERARERAGRLALR
jgi:5-methylthioadenosine/S-adenosylhomocysteine deaminase